MICYHLDLLSPGTILLGVKVSTDFGGNLSKSIVLSPQLKTLTYGPVLDQQRPHTLVFALSAFSTQMISRCIQRPSNFSITASRW